MVYRIHVDLMLSLRKAHEKLRQCYVQDNRTNEFDGYEVLILMLTCEPRSAKCFSDLLSCKSSQITGYVSRLENSGLLKRKISEHDRRSFNFQLTKLGRLKAEALLKITGDIFQSNTYLIETENLDLMRLLDKI